MNDLQCSALLALIPMETNKGTSRRGCGGCLWGLLGLCFIAGLFIIPIALTPYLRETRPVTVTVTDEAGKPVSNAALSIFEHEWVHYVPILVFASPSRIYRHEQTVTTDSEGKAQFTVKLENAYCPRIALGTQVLRVLSYQTTDSFRGTREPFHVPARSDYGIDWGAIGGVAKVSYQTAIVVSLTLPK
ncbi:MAG: Ig-like domain-containing protein [Prosthecobacter sp.]|nr:Ig-like domain-containing protein [Prosthecobacter sp.]